MFRDCLRCGAGWHERGGTKHRQDCICKGMTDEQAVYLMSLHTAQIKIRQIGRKALAGEELDKHDLHSLGIYV